MAEHAVPSDSKMYDSYSQQDKELRERANRFWMRSQALNTSIGYAGVEEMIAIDDKHPFAVQVKIQEKRLELLQKMDEELPGHTQRRLECRDGGAPQITGSQEIDPSKRAPSPSQVERPPILSVSANSREINWARLTCRPGTDKGISAY
jgi:hypothetical protein